MLIELFYFQKLQRILTEQHIDVNVDTCVRTKEDSASSCSSSSPLASAETHLSSHNKNNSKSNIRNKNIKNTTRGSENKRSKCGSKPNLPPPLIMLPKPPNLQPPPLMPLQHQPSPTTPSSSSGCSSPSINSPLLGPNQQQIMHTQQGQFISISPNQQSYPPPLTPRTPSNSTGKFQKRFLY